MTPIQKAGQVILYLDPATFVAPFQAHHRRNREHFWA